MLSLLPSSHPFTLAPLLVAAVLWTEAASADGLLAPRPFGTAGGVRIAFENDRGVVRP